MAEEDAAKEKLKKYEKAVKKLKAANAKAEKELASQKSTFEAALAEKSTLVETLKAAGGGDKKEDSTKAKLEETVEDQKDKIKEQEGVIKKGEDNAKLQEQATKDKLEGQKLKIEEEWKKKFLEAALDTDKPKEKKVAARVKYLEITYPVGLNLGWRHSQTWLPYLWFFSYYFIQ